MKAKNVMMGFVTNNPVFVLVLGMCPTLAKSTTLSNAFWLGVCTTFVLVFSNLLISLLRKLIPDRVRIPCYIVIIATLVTVVDMFLAKFMPAVYLSIGQFIALITVNCIILARAESFANNNPPHMAMLDGVSMGVGFILAICLLGFLRELIGRGAILGHQLIGGFTGIAVFATPAGAFIMLGILMAVFNLIYNCVKTKSDIRARMAAQLEVRG